MRKPPPKTPNPVEDKTCAGCGHVGMRYQGTKRGKIVYKCEGCGSVRQPEVSTERPGMRLECHEIDVLPSPCNECQSRRSCLVPCDLFDEYVGAEKNARRMAAYMERLDRRNSLLRKLVAA